MGNKFSKDTPLTMTRGKVIEYLCMTIKYSNKEKVKMCMFEYIDKSSATRHEGGIYKMPAANQLFTINENFEVLNVDKAQRFYHLVAKLLYLCRCNRQDVQTAIAFL